jgi:uncharacterized protein YndB with AHSA1/START domain
MGGTCEVRLTRHYRAAPDEVWAALTDPDSLRRWLAAPVEIDLRSRGSFRLQLSERERMDGRVRAVEPPRTLELDWMRTGEEPSIIRFVLSPERDGTEFVLQHLRIEAQIGMRYMAVWERRLRAFDAEVER